MYEKEFDSMFSRFDTISVHDRQSDGQSFSGYPVYQYCVLAFLRIRTRDKK